MNDKSCQLTGLDGKDPEGGWITRNGECAIVASSALLLFLLVGSLCVPVVQQLGGEAIAEGRDHEGSGHEGVSSLLGERQPVGGGHFHTAQSAQREQPEVPG